MTYLKYKHEGKYTKVILKYFIVTFTISRMTDTQTDEVAG